VGLNILLDLVFVVLLHGGVGGAALATVLSQGLSAALVFRKLLTTEDVYRLKLSEIRIWKDQLGEIVRIGLPGGVQNCLVSLSNVLIQSSINSFDTYAIAGCGAYFKVEGFALMPAGSFALAMTTFVSQNMGAGRQDRAKKGAVVGLVLSCALATCIGIGMVCMAPILIRTFNSDPDVVRFGVSQMRTEAWFYALLAFSHGIAGVLRGVGRSKVPMFTMAICWCGLRITVMPIILRQIHSIYVLYWTYPCTWAISSVVLILYCLHARIFDIKQEKEVLAK
jgi:putative MATE family efflux protein